MLRMNFRGDQKVGSITFDLIYAGRAETNCRPLGYELSKEVCLASEVGNRVGI